MKLPSKSPGDFFEHIKRPKSGKSMSRCLILPSDYPNGKVPDDGGDLWESMSSFGMTKVLGRLEGICGEVGVDLNHPGAADIIKWFMEEIQKKKLMESKLTS